MVIKHGNGTTEYGPGVSVRLTSDELATAILAYLMAHGVNITGPRTVFVNGELCVDSQVYVDPSGDVYHDGKQYSGRGE